MPSCPSRFAALACLRDSLGLASWAGGASVAGTGAARTGAAGTGAAGTGTVGSFPAWDSSGNNSGEEDGLRDGRDRVLKRFWDDCLSKEWVLPLGWI